MSPSPLTEYRRCLNVVGPGSQTCGRVYARPNFPASQAESYFCERCRSKAVKALLLEQAKLAAEFAAQQEEDV